MKKMMLTLSVVLALGLIAGAAGAAVVNTVDFWFADAAGVKIDTLDVAPGAEFGFSVYGKTSDAWEFTSMELLVGWANASTRGATAVLTSPFESVSFNVDLSGFDSMTLNTVGGGKNATDATQGSGGNFIQPKWLLKTTMTEPTKLVTLKLKNSGLAVGDTYSIKIWRAATPATMGWSSWLGVTGNQNQEAAHTELLVTSKGGDTPVVPEPGSMVALGTGLMGLVGFVLRRKA